MPGERTTADALLAELGHAPPFPPPGTPPSLDRMHALLDRLGNPHVGLPIVHVGGTAGKGSTATMIAALLHAAGYRVGLHTKPHLAHVHERVRVDGTPISDTDLRALIADATDAARAVGPSWFELTVALALLHFRRVRADIAVIEVGMGGTWDGTNVVQPLVAVLTNVGLDHTEILGDTVEQIARDKVGIIKPGCVAVSGATQPGVRTIIAARAAAVGAPLWLSDREFEVEDVRRQVSGSRFALRLPERTYTGLYLPLLGTHQIANAALALAAAPALAPAGFAVPEDAVREALRTIHLPGRLEVVGRLPAVVLDGAHNPDKLDAVLAAVRDYLPHGRLIAVVAFTRRHDWGAMLARLAPVADRIVLTGFAAAGDSGPGASVPTADLETALAALPVRGDVLTEADPLTAVYAARAVAAPGDCVLVTGSLYLVGAVRDTLLAEGMG